MKTILFTFLSLVAFAANSILCRFALGGELIDAASFTSIRICSGAVFLGIIYLFTKHNTKHIYYKNQWLMPVMLTIYALFFSYAYISLSTGTGALILFGAVQATMIISGWISGERMNFIQFAGLFLAIAGLVYLVFPGLSAPSPLGAVLMAIAGIAWGIYSLLGRQAKDPVITTVMNFIYSIPIVLIAGFLISSPVLITSKGVLAAVISGTLASGAGYVIWYAALKGLNATRAAIIQLTVPVIAAIGGIILLSEVFSARLFIASIIILSGVGLVLSKKKG
ncbi:MAG: DMT family transporter [Desulfobacula sp.]|jgi:drug/metabolite transporter (DMT)-like permease|nr:DMT family transporter [Desulfobacula sp.]